jgi:hypothetical protein
VRVLEEIASSPRSALSVMRLHNRMRNSQWPRQCKYQETKLVISTQSLLYTAASRP